MRKPFLWSCPVVPDLFITTEVCYRSTLWADIRPLLSASPLHHQKQSKLTLSFLSNRNSKKSITSAMVFAAYCAGNMAGPQFIYANEKPRYQSGAYAMSESLLPCFFSFPRLYPITDDSPPSSSSSSSPPLYSPSTTKVGGYLAKLVAHGILWAIMFGQQIPSSQPRRGRPPAPIVERVHKYQGVLRRLIGGIRSWLFLRNDHFFRISSHPSRSFLRYFTVACTATATELPLKSTIMGFNTFDAALPRLCRSLVPDYFAV